MQGKAAAVGQKQPPGVSKDAKPLGTRWGFVARTVMKPASHCR